MENGFLKFSTNPKKLYGLILIIGVVLSIGLGISAYRESKLPGSNELSKNQAGEGTYEQKLIAILANKRIPLKVTVEERTFTQLEAEEELKKAMSSLDDVLKATNEDLTAILNPICFADAIPGTAVEVTWTERAEDYFYSDGSFREELEITEPIEVKVAAILSCQKYSKDYEAVMTLLPRAVSDEKRLLEIIQKNAIEEQTEDVIHLPEEYKGNAIIWRKPIDITFLYVFALAIAAVVFLKIGEQKDARDQKRELLASYEKDYAQIVSKFTMLLSAGLSVRNAWERIVLLNRGKPEGKRPIMFEMSQSYREMQKGVSELEIYEQFGTRVGQIHYKKLMALFISNKKRGSVNLLEAMNQEMLQAWEEQKRSAKQQGEKIGTNLLLPMIGMLTIVFIMILVPAFLSFKT